MLKTQTEKNKGFVMINLLSTGEIHRPMWLYILRLLVLFLLPTPVLYALFVPAAALSRAALARSQNKWCPFRYFKPSMSPSEHNRHYSGLLACLNCWREQGELGAEVLISEQPFRFSESS